MRTTCAVGHTSSLDPADYAETTARAHLLCHILKVATVPLVHDVIDVEVEDLATTLETDSHQDSFAPAFLSDGNLQWTDRRDKSSQNANYH
jgi:hypothetical protein